MPAYYNEIDPYAAEWLHRLIMLGHIAPGDVDTRSIEDVRPDDLKGYTQCHFFAGIGIWSHALRLAGWPDDRQVWTGSCPCPPFSVAGANAGFNDERHLWPAWHWLVSQCKPSVIFGEQVDAAIRHGWLDIVQADMEGIGYAFAAIGLPAAGVGAPHIRQRLWFVADSTRDGREQRRAESDRGRAVSDRCARGLADVDSERRTREHVRIRERQDENLPEAAGRGGAAIRRRKRADASDAHPFQGTDAACAVNGFWKNADWLFCRDGKWRPVEPGTFPLAHGAPARVGRLRAYGNAIVAQVAAEVITAYMDS